MARTISSPWTTSVGQRKAQSANGQAAARSPLLPKLRMDPILTSEWGFSRAWTSRDVYGVDRDHTRISVMQNGQIHFSEGISLKHTGQYVRAVMEVLFIRSRPTGLKEICPWQIA